jgi:hypothetical protein
MATRPLAHDSPHPSGPTTPGARRALRMGARGLLLAWAAFWAWFIGMHFVSEGASALLPGGSILAAILVVALVPWRWPRAGGMLALGAAAGAAISFQHPGAWALLAAPAALAGLALLASGGGRSARA